MLDARLFVCRRNRLQSPTAEAIFAEDERLECLSAGTAVDAETPVSGDLIDWEEMIFVMEMQHKKSLQARFGALLRGRKVVVLKIPDEYDYMDAELVRVLKERVAPYL